MGYQNTHSPASYHPTPSPMAYQVTWPLRPLGLMPQMLLYVNEMANSCILSIDYEKLLLVTGVSCHSNIH